MLSVFSGKKIQGGNSNPGISFGLGTLLPLHKEPAGSRPRGPLGQICMTCCLCLLSLPSCFHGCRVLLNCSPDFREQESKTQK